MNYNKIISPEELSLLFERGEKIELIDIREQILYFKPIDKSIHIPASQIINFIGNLNKNKTIVLYCSHGVDSFFVMNMLYIDHGFENVYSLKGGVEAWYKFINSKNKL